jgi:hypothetical protein
LTKRVKSELIAGAERATEPSGLSARTDHHWLNTIA